MSFISAKAERCSSLHLVALTVAERVSVASMTSSGCSRVQSSSNLTVHLSFSNSKCEKISCSSIFIPNISMIVYKIQLFCNINCLQSRLMWPLLVDQPEEPVDPASLFRYRAPFITHLNGLSIIIPEIATSHSPLHRSFGLFCQLESRLLELLYFTMPNLLRGPIQLLLHSIDLLSQASNCLVIGHTQKRLKIVAAFLMLAQVSFPYRLLAAHAVPKCLLQLRIIIAFVCFLLPCAPLAIKGECRYVGVLFVFFHAYSDLLLDYHLQARPLLANAGMIVFVNLKFIEQIVK